jgi:segregation and condensation protein B
MVQEAQMMAGDSSVERKQIIEALLFASQDPLSLARIQAILATDDRQGILRDVQMLQREYGAPNRAFQVVEVAGGYQFRTRPELRPWVLKLKGQRGAYLSQASLESLAIVAYKQPITRAEIEYIRGVDCGAVLRGLLEKGLLKILGRKDVPGRPLLYGTSKRFLEVFSLRDLSGLPDLREIEEMGEARETAASQSSLFDEEEGAGGQR